MMGSGASQPVPTTTYYQYPVQQYPPRQQHQQHAPTDPHAPPNYHDYMSSAPPREPSPPPDPTTEPLSYHHPPPLQQHTAEWTSNPSLLQSYGEQDYALREMTWPMEQAFPGLDPMTSPTVSNVTSPAETAYDASPSCEMLLTAQDVREGEAFIAEMEQKRQEYESTQTELLRRLRIPDNRNPQAKDETTELITIICQSHHFLYGGHEDDLGIEFEPADDLDEDNYILGQIDSLSKRHHQELKRSDQLCAGKLLQGRGADMTEQKLDSILEEHIKLRGYMRTRQTKHQVEAYYQVQASIRANPGLYKSTVTTTPQPQQAQVIIAQHPIVQRLPPISQAKLKKIGPTRGRTVTVGSDNHIVPQQQQTLGLPKVGGYGSKQATNFRGSPIVESDPEDGAADLQDGKLALKPRQLESASIWAQSSLKVESSDSEDEQNHFSKRTQQSTSTFASSAATQQNSAPVGFTIVSANPKYIANVIFGPTPTAIPASSSNVAHQANIPEVSKRMNDPQIINESSESEDDGNSTDMLRTGVFPGMVSSRLSQFNTAEQHNQSTNSDLDKLNGFEKRLQSNSSENRQKKTEDMYAEDYDDDFEDEDLVAHYQRTLGAGAVSEDGESMTSSDRVLSSRADNSSSSESEDEQEPRKLVASAKLNNDLTDAIWENKEDMNPQEFKALISMWQEKNNDIKQSGEVEDIQRVNGRVLWQRAKDRVMYDAIENAGVQNSSDEEEDSGVSDGWTQSAGRGVSASMQTSLTRNQSASVQTDAMGVDAETLVDEFLTDDSEKKKIKKMDRELAEQLFSGELNEDEIKELLARNRANIERLRLEREAKRLKSLDLMREKKNRKKHQAADEGETAMDEETKEKIEQIEEKVKRKLIKHRDNISEKDVKRLLNEARKQQDDIIRQRNIERVKQNEMMRKRLLEKKLAKNKDSGEGDSSGPKKSAEDDFYSNLQTRLAAGDLTHEQFKRLIEKHLNELSQKSKPKPAIQEDESQMKEARAKRASSIVKKSHEKNRAILDMRQRERDNARAELKQKRKMKREKPSLV